MTDYDSRYDTIAHINRVEGLIYHARNNLMGRGKNHDVSKLEAPEKPAFDRLTPRLAATTYGGEEYKECLKELGPALQHHYCENDHHPEHFAEGISGMSLLSLIEMLCDWKAASERHADGDIAKSLYQNARRFGIGVQLQYVLWNTAIELGFLPSDLEPDIYIAGAEEDV